MIHRTGSHMNSMNAVLLFFSTNIDCKIVHYCHEHLGLHLTFRHCHNDRNRVAALVDTGANDYDDAGDVAAVAAGANDDDADVNTHFQPVASFDNLVHVTRHGYHDNYNYNCTMVAMDPVPIVQSVVVPILLVPVGYNLINILN